ncbi:MAG: hypothetical protein HYR63_20345 [Proteobacteria bacterium]|nr:hypothetical protein [Pseudomonadota bacterium]MBI3497046.1 hypothetical protein [Pseudomonadota bacterium]
MTAAQQAKAMLALFAMGWQRAGIERAALLGRALLYGLVLLIFQGIWQSTPLAELAGPGYDTEGLIWYVAVTEWIVFATAYPYREVEADIRGGRIAQLASRPVPYLAAVAAEWAGASGFRLLALGGFGFAATILMTGTVPIAWSAGPGLLLSALLAMALAFLLQFAIGLVAVWMGTAAPVYWIAQKLFFVMGGLLLPLSIYPSTLGAIAEASPFAAMLYAPASLLLDAGSAGLGQVLLGQGIWLALLAAGALAIEHRAIRRITREGI